MRDFKFYANRLEFGRVFLIYWAHNFARFLIIFARVGTLSLPQIFCLRISQDYSSEVNVIK